MTIQELYAAWQESVQRALATQISRENSQEDELLQATGLEVKTGVLVSMDCGKGVPTFGAGS